MKLGNYSRLALWALIVAAASTSASAETLKERIQERMQQRGSSAADATDQLEVGGNDMSCAEWAKKVSRLEGLAGSRNVGPAPDLADIAYGPEALAKLDVFFARATMAGPAPIIMMVHGGGWCVGDKGGEEMTANKVARWVPKGFLFVSVNYPMVNDGADALAQANYVAKAAAFVQANAGKWGGDPGRLILMGHSAGAHLVSLVNTDARIREANGLRPILGTVSLDAGAIDVVKEMPNVYPFLKTRYREAFGNTEAKWIAASPFYKLDRTAVPWLGVCSTTRKDNPCGQAQAYAEKSKGLGIRAAVLPERMSHGAINKELGAPGSYTDSVEAFMASLDQVVAKLLNRGSGLR
jgi:arylformamidase